MLDTVREDSVDGHSDIFRVSWDFKFQIPPAARSPSIYPNFSQGEILYEEATDGQDTSVNTGTPGTSALRIKAAGWIVSPGGLIREEQIGA